MLDKPKEFRLSVSHTEIFKGLLWSLPKDTNCKAKHCFSFWTPEIKGVGTQTHAAAHQQFHSSCWYVSSFPFVRAEERASLTTGNKLPLIYHRLRARTSMGNHNNVAGVLQCALHLIVWYLIHHECDSLSCHWQSQWSFEPSCSFSSGLCISLTHSSVFCPPHFIVWQRGEPLKLFLIWRGELRVITRVQQSLWLPKRFACTHIADDRKLVGASLYFPAWGKTAHLCWKEHITTYCLRVKCHAKGHAVQRRNGLISVDTLLHTVTRLSS